MNVERTFNFFSKKIAKAIRLAGENPNSSMYGSNDTPNTWRQTAAFTEEMDVVIDGADAYKLIFHNPAKRPLSLRNPQIEKTLKNFVG